MPTILVTGGTGFIGSHTTVALQQAGHDVLILDNLHNSSIHVIDAIARITGHTPAFVKGDIRDASLLAQLFAQHDISAVMHFAGLKAVGESSQIPLSYHDNNVRGSITLLQAMQQAGVRTFIFSSSATVYGKPQHLPLTEDHPRSATNPYGQTKLVVEDILESLYQSEPNWRIARLRYFNPAGAHPSGLIGETPQGIPNNLIPYIAQVAVGQRPHLHVFGNDYDTQDGTGVRDYIHILDLAAGHVAALDHCCSHAQTLLTTNLGTGRGYSVLEMIKAYEQACGRDIPYQIVARRAGDVAACWADTRHAQHTLGWKARLDLESMCQHSWRWVQQS